MQLRPIFLLAASVALVAAGTVNATTGPPVCTLEDLFGDTGNSFQAAVGFLAMEGTPFEQGTDSYGLAVDDMVVAWREFTLGPDATDCAVSGSCATIEIEQDNVFEGNTELTVTVVDGSPPAVNDCNEDGDAIDAGIDDGDCNDNGIPDLLVRAVSELEVEGETVVVDLVAGGLYRGLLTISSLGDTDPGILFVGPTGAGPPTVTVSYFDADDGTGQVCKNDVDPAKWGFVRAATFVFLGASCEIVVVNTLTADNGDHDVFADDNETVDVRLELMNNCGFDLTNCVARISTNDPDVDCIIDGVIDLGDLADSADPSTTVEAFRIMIGDVGRISVSEQLRAEFTLTISCDEIDALSIPQSFALELDLDEDDFGQPSLPYQEGFESGTLAGSGFVAENNDAGIPGPNNNEGLINGDGWRCQYSPLNFGSCGSSGCPEEAVCYPTENFAHSNEVFWRIDGSTIANPASPDGGRAFEGTHSLYYGVFLTNPAGEFTSPMAVVEGVRTIDPINLAVAENAMLSIWHQASLVDWRSINSTPGQSADRGVLMVQEADTDEPGTPIGDWIRLEPFQNSYDQPNEDNYFNCMFDPVDDGNTEDDFFDPSDPNRRTGPSSTCSPGLNFSWMGDTDDPFQVDNIGNATTPPAADSHLDAFGVGTWVESKFSLADFRARRVRLRFLVSAMKIEQENWEAQFMHNPDPTDDGWWIDAIEIDHTLENPAVLSADTGELRGCLSDPVEACFSDSDCPGAAVGDCAAPAPPCGPTCLGIDVGVETTPDIDATALFELLPAPGQAITINAVSSSPVDNRCLDGTIQYRFSNAVTGEQLRGWSDNPIVTDAPILNTDYVVEVRCSSDTTCASAAIVDVDVDCPSTGTLHGPPAFGTIEGNRGAAPCEFFWSFPASPVEVWSGSLDAVSSYAGGILQRSETALTEFSDNGAPAAGQGRYYVAHVPGTSCNDGGFWTSGGPGEEPAREGSLP